jgi:heat shock protein HtpX
MHERLADGDRAGPPPPRWRRQSARRRRRSRLHSVLLLAGMAALLAYCGWIVADWPGVLWSLVASAAMLLVLRRLPPRLVLQTLRAEPVSRLQAPGLYRILDNLCQTAEVRPPPLLFRIFGPVPVAFTLGGQDAATIVLSQSVIEAMDAREIRGILAHEIIHLRNGDLPLMQLAVVVGRLTRVLSQLAFMLLFLGLVVRAVWAGAFPLAPLVPLAVAPLGVNLLQLALSRTREAEADLEAAELTGDPLGLARALAKMRAQEQAILRSRYPGMVLLPVPLLFRDHPATGERIKRLLAMPPSAESGLIGESPGDFRRRRGIGPWGW